jgi:radical SAM superfamily enzyme YgiQ (UPF0313 family)
MKKRVTLDQIRTAFRITREEGMQSCGSFILGYPGETLDEMRQTIRFACELGADYAQFCVLTPYPGTPIYDELKSKGLLLTEDWDRYTTLEPVVKYEAFGYTAKQVKKMLNYAYRHFYLRPKYVIKHLKFLPLILGVSVRSFIIPKLGLDRLTGSGRSRISGASTP